MSDREVVSIVIPVIKRHMPMGEHYRVFLFGSRATGQNDERSDFDIGIEGSDKIPAAVMGKILLDVEELPLLQTVEVVDFKTVSEEFRRVAGKRVKILYEQ